MKRRGIAHRILAWRGPKPTANIQAAARAARYRLLEEWCAARGVLHLVLGHQRGDQAETLLLRLARGSGAFGLAAMPAVQERPGVRLLRPFLAVPRAALRGFLQREGQPWLDDPSNRNRRFARVRWRAALGGDGREAARLAAATFHLGRARAAIEAAVAACLARAVTLHPEAHARLDLAALASAGLEIGGRALAALVTTIGGGRYVPRYDSLEELYRDLMQDRLGGGRTLAGCRILPLSGEPGRILVCRELRGIERVTLRGKGAIRWDGRFVLQNGTRSRTVELGALGATGWAEIVARAPWLRRCAVPAPARLALAALRDSAVIRAVPQIAYDRARPGAPAAPRIELIHRPERALAVAYFAAFAPLVMRGSTIV